MIKPTNEMLMAFADGELEGPERAAVEAAMAADPEVARAVERHRALRARLAVAWDDVMAEPVPARLAAALAAPAAVPAAPVVDLSSRRAPRRFGPPVWLAAAASLVVGVSVGLFVLRGPQSPFGTEDGVLVAQGVLAQALDHRLAAEGATAGVRLGLSFRDRQGAYCRTFSLEDGVPLAGLACRGGEGWQLRVLAASEPAGELRTAAAMPQAVLTTVNAAIAGEPLDARAEAAARHAGWR